MLKMKVCGMKIPENIKKLSELNIDFMGFIFYKKSKRYTESIPDKIPKTIKKIGVFVNEDINTIKEIASKNKLDYIQLHGNETVEYCKKLSSSKHKIIKAFSIDEKFDFKQTYKYQAYCDFFIFDTKGKLYGGNGIKFNWQLLENYKGENKFLLSGGISLKDIEEIKKFKHPKYIGVDVNSGFEIKPGLKNISEISEFLKLYK